MTQRDKHTPTGSLGQRYGVPIVIAALLFTMAAWRPAVQPSGQASGDTDIRINAGILSVRISIS